MQYFIVNLMSRQIIHHSLPLRGQKPGDELVACDKSGVSATHCATSESWRAPDCEKPEVAYMTVKQLSGFVYIMYTSHALEKGGHAIVQSYDGTIKTLSVFYFITSDLRFEYLKI